MNRQFHEIEEWNETEIFERTKNLLRLAINLWQRPETGPSDTDEIMSINFDSFSSTWDLIGNSETDSDPKTAKLKLRDLFASGIIRSGDNLVIRNRSNSEATAINDSEVRVAETGEILTWNEYGQRFTGHVAVNIYKQVLVNGVLLGALRSKINQKKTDEVSFPSSDAS